MLRFFVLALSLLAIAIAVIGAFVGFSLPANHHLRVPVMLAFALPFAGVIVLHRVPRLRSYAYPIAAGSALVVVLTCGVFAGVLLLFIGFTMGNKDQLAFALAAPAYVLTQIPLAIAAIVAWRKLPTEERPRNAWGIGIGVPMAYALLVLGAGALYSAHLEQSSVGAIANDTAAAAATRKAVDCLAAYRDVHGGGFPATLDAVAGCLGDARSAFAGYKVAYVPGLPDERGRVLIYSLCAQAEEIARTGWHTFVADEAGVGAAYEFDTESRKTPGCGFAWQRDLLRRVKHCVLTYAALNPRQGYPATLTPLGTSGNRCLADGGDLRGLDDVSVTAFDSVVLYQPGPPGDGARITRFEMRTKVRTGRDSYQVMVDETGARYANAEGEAKRGDAPPAEVQERLSALARAKQAQAESLSQRCEERVAADCAQLGFLQYSELNNYSRGLEAWHKACTLKDREGCFFVLSKEKDMALFGYGLSDKRDCSRGEPARCKRLAYIVAHFEGCSRDAQPADCAEIAYLFARGGNSPRANELWNAACDKRHKESCLLAKSRDFDYVRIFKLKDACITGDDGACAELAKRVAQVVFVP